MYVIVTNKAVIYLQIRFQVKTPLYVILFCFF